MGDIPSGPGAVRGFIYFRANSTSSTMYSLVRFKFMAGVTFVSIP